MSKSNLVDSMKKVLVNTFDMYFKSHGMHWNIEGIYFSQLHDFFSDLYTELHSAVDVAAEQIRALDSYVEYGCKEFCDIGSVPASNIFGNKPKEMLSDLLVANTIVVSSLNAAFKLATQENNQGLMDFLAARLDVHAKHAWMIKSLMKE
jgi:starvation-inducible DNA-binding protein